MEQTNSIENKLKEIIGNLVFQVAALQTENEQLKSNIKKMEEEQTEQRDLERMHRVS